MAILNLNGPLELYSPEWWLRRLLSRLMYRRSVVDEFDRFYLGTQPLAFASAKFREVFGERYSRLPANFMPLVVDAERERLAVQGFRFGDATRGDKDVWRIWQLNQLDAESQIAHEIALSKGVAYTIVAPGEDGPVITIEDPTETIVETQPGNRRLRSAALKMWTDDERFMRAYLYLPDTIYKFRSAKAVPERIEGWPAPSMVGESEMPVTFDGDVEVEVHTLGVPVIPLLNRPRRDGTGRSEIEPVMGNQNAINKLRFDALVASEFVAFPQRWVTNIDIPVVDGKEIAPFKPGVDNLWASRLPTPEEAAQYGDKYPSPTFGQFPAADLKPYIDMMREEVGQMASISRTPYHYLLGEPTSVPPSGESLKSSEAPLVKKVGAQAVHFGEGWEETMRVALKADGQESKARNDAETMWADPETRNEAARTDSIIKQHAAGLIPDEFALEELGYSQQQIQRILDMKEQERLETPEPPPTPPTPEVSGVPGLMALPTVRRA